VVLIHDRQTQTDTDRHRHTQTHTDIYNTTVLTAQLKKIEREKKKRIKRRAVTRSLSEKRKRKQKPICGIECFLEKGEMEKKKDQ
jgi:hypothetical protein